MAVLLIWRTTSPHPPLPVGSLSMCSARKTPTLFFYGTLRVATPRPAICPKGFARLHDPLLSQPNCNPPSYHPHPTNQTTTSTHLVVWHSSTMQGHIRPLLLHRHQAMKTNPFPTMLLKHLQNRQLPFPTT